MPVSRVPRLLSKKRCEVYDVLKPVDVKLARQAKKLCAMVSYMRQEMLRDLPKKVSREYLAVLENLTALINDSQVEDEPALRLVKEDTGDE